MGRYLTPGHQYNDGDTVTGPSLTEHVAESTFKTTGWTEQTLKTPAALTDQLLVVASGAFFQETLQQIHDLILYPGCVVQTAYAEYTANTNLTAVIPQDDTIPQNTEGTEIISLSITPRFVTSQILASFQGGWAGNSTAFGGVFALFREPLVDAIAARCIVYPNPQSTALPQYVTEVNFNYLDSPATVSSVIYKIRVGPNIPATTMRMNGNGTGRDFGGVARTTLVLQEIKQ